MRLELVTMSKKTTSHSDDETPTPAVRDEASGIAPATDGDEGEGEGKDDTDALRAAADATSRAAGKTNGKSNGKVATESLDEGVVVPAASGQGGEAAPPPSAEEQLAAMKDQLLRMAADFDNYRKRARKEIEDARTFGISNLLHDVLPVIDNLDRALTHAADEKSAVVQGIKLVAKQLVDSLSRYGVTGFVSTGKVFDPEKHEAVGQKLTAEAAPGTIVEELQRGYMLHDRLLRPARVLVAMAPAEVAPSADESVD